MTDPKPDNTDSAVKPQVIDLEAEDVTPAGERENGNEKETSETAFAEAAAPPLPPRVKRRSRGGASWIAAALVLGLAAGGWLYRDVLSAYLPTGEMTAMKQRVDLLEAKNKTLNEQLAAVAQSADAASRAAANAGQEVKSAATDIAALARRAGQTEARMSASDKSVKSAVSDIASLRSTLSSIGSSSPGGTGTADTAALVALGQRIDALEKDVASLKSNSGKGDKASVTAALSQALSDLKAKVAAGAPYAVEYDRLSRMVPAAAGLDILGAHADAGIPSPQGLAVELRAAIPSLPKPAEPKPAGDSYWDSLLSSLSGIVTIRNIGDSDWPQVAEKAAAFAEAGDLPQAIETIDSADGAKPSALSQWSDRAAARLKLEAASNALSEAVLRQIAALEQAP